VNSFFKPSIKLSFLYFLESTFVAFFWAFLASFEVVLLALFRALSMLFFTAFLDGLLRQYAFVIFPSLRLKDFIQLQEVLVRHFSTDNPLQDEAAWLSGENESAIVKVLMVSENFIML